jgi:Na+-transporting methylmalonyl-CoA/oxaloacetate decarboxylase gamma subunit
MTAQDSAPKTLLASGMPLRVLGAALVVAVLWVLVAWAL